MQNWFKKLTIFLGVTAMVLLIPGCGSGGGSDPGVSQGDSVGSFSGNTTLSGTITSLAEGLSQVSYDESGSLNPTSVQTLGYGTFNERGGSQVVQNLPVPEAVVELYAVDEDGELIFTGERTQTDENGEYTFDNVADDQTYVVKGEKYGYDQDGNPKKLELETIERVNDGETLVECDIDTGTNLLVSDIMTRLKESAIPEEFLKEMIALVEDTLSELIEAGTIRIEPVYEPIELATGQTLEEKHRADLEDLTELDKIEHVVEDDHKAHIDHIRNDEDLIDKDKELKTEAILADSNPDLDSAKQLIKSVLNMVDDDGSGQGSDIGNFYVTNFAQAFLDKVSMPIDKIAEEFLATTTGVDKTHFELLTEWKEMFSTNLSLLYDAYDDPSKFEALEEEMPNLPVIKAVFPDELSKRIDLTNIPDDFELNVPQSLVAFEMFGLFEMEDNFDHIMFLAGMGILDTTVTSAELTRAVVSTVHLYLPDDIQNLHSGWSEQQALDVKVSVWSPVTAVTEVKLEYVKNDGTRAEKVILPDFSRGGSGEVEYRLNPYDFHDMRDLSNVISDFKAGSARLVVYGGTEVLASQEVNLMKADITGHQWVYPVGMNQIEREKEKLEDGSPDGTGDETDVESEFQSTVVKHDDDGNYLTFSWDPATGTVPEGFHLKYIVNLGLSIERLDYSQSVGDISDIYDAYADFADVDRDMDSPEEPSHIHLWSTYRHNNHVFGTSYTMNKSLPESMESVDNNYRTAYNISVRPALINNASGEVVWAGTQQYTQFSIGNPSEWDATVTLELTIGDDLTSTLPEEEGVVRIGVFEDYSNSNGFHQEHWYENGDKTPIAGTSQVVDFNNPVIEFEFSSTDFPNPSKYESFRVVMWYDFSDTGQQGAIDKETSVEGWSYFVEGALQLPVDIQVDRGSLFFKNHASGDTIFVKDDVTTEVGVDSTHFIGGVHHDDEETVHGTHPDENIQP